jgi:tRNA (cmo5U34)-methyltransferase
MVDQSIAAYELPDRVASYDASMEIMHPNRAKMVQVALEVIPFPPDQPLCALDIGVGTGYFTEKFLRRYPNSLVWAIDGAAAMIDLAKARLGPLASRVRFVVGNFRNLAALVPDETFDVAFSSFALHHLGRDDKESVVRQTRDRLKPGGWFLNADILASDTPEIEERIQQLRIAGIVRRARGIDPRFPDAETTRQFLAGLEATDGDQPLPLPTDLQILHAASLRGVTALWLEYREAVCGGMR